MVSGGLQCSHKTLVKLIIFLTYDKNGAIKLARTPSSQSLMKKIKFVILVIAMIIFVHPNRWKHEYEKLKNKNNGIHK